MLILMFALYAVLLWWTNRKAMIFSCKTYHYIFNAVSLVSLVVTWMTPANQWIGFAFACTVLVVELCVVRYLKKSKEKVKK